MSLLTGSQRRGRPPGRLDFTRSQFIAALDDAQRELGHRSRGGQSEIEIAVAIGIGRGTLRRYRRIYERPARP